MDFNHAIKSLMSDMGLKETPGDMIQPLVLVFDEQWTLTCEEDPNADEMVFSIPIPSATKTVLEQADNAMKIMAYSLLGAQTGSCALSYSPDTESMVIWQRHQNDFTDGQVITKLMNRMVEAAASIDEWCKMNLEQSEKEDGQTDSPNASSLENLADWFRV